MHRKKNELNFNVISHSYYINKILTFFLISQIFIIALFKVLEQVEN